MSALANRPFVKMNGLGNAIVVEDIRAEIRADFFNALNTAHYANPNGTLGNANCVITPSAPSEPTSSSRVSGLK